MEHVDVLIVGAGLSGVFGHVGTGLYTILQTDFRELPFHALR